MENLNHNQLSYRIPKNQTIYCPAKDSRVFRIAVEGTSIFIATTSLSFLRTLGDAISLYVSSNSRKRLINSGKPKIYTEQTLNEYLAEVRTSKASVMEKLYGSNEPSIDMTVGHLTASLHRYSLDISFLKNIINTFVKKSLYIEQIPEARKSYNKSLEEYHKIDEQCTKLLEHALLINYKKFLVNAQKTTSSKSDIYFLITSDKKFLKKLFYGYQTHNENTLRSFAFTIRYRKHARNRKKNI